MFRSSDILCCCLNRNFGDGSLKLRLGVNPALSMYSVRAEPCSGLGSWGFHVFTMGFHKDV